MFERFTEGARRVLVLGQEEAHLLGHGFIGTEHLLLGLIREGESTAWVALASLGVDLENARARVAEILGRTDQPATGSAPFTPRAKLVLELSLREALQLGHNYVGGEHILLGLVREGEGVAVVVMEDLGADAATVRQSVLQQLGGRATVRHPLDAVDGEDVEATDLPVEASSLLRPADAERWVADQLVAEPRHASPMIHGVRYETCTYRLGRVPEVSVSVAAAEVSRAAFDAYTTQMAGAEEVPGLGDAATYSSATAALRVLSGTTLFVVQVRQHPKPREAAIAVAERALANIRPERVVASRVCPLPRAPATRSGQTRGG